MSKKAKPPSEWHMVLIFIPAAMIIFPLIESWIWGTIYSPSFFFATFTMMLLAASLNPKFLRKQIKEEIEKGPDEDGMRWSGLMLICAPLLQFVAMVVLCRAIWIKYGTSAFSVPSAPNILNWIGFTLQNFLSVVCLDTFEVYGLNVSDVEHNKKFWMSTVVFAYRTSLGVGIVSYVAKGIKARAELLAKGG